MLGLLVVRLGLSELQDVGVITAPFKEYFIYICFFYNNFSFGQKLNSVIV